MSIVNKHQVVIIGGGFGGLCAAKALRQEPIDITLIDKRNFHLFQPLLYQVATGGISPANISSPLRSILKDQKNVQVLLGEVSDLDPENKKVILKDGHHYFYDSLIVATGVSHHYFGHKEWEKYAPGLKTIEDATSIRSRILLSFEKAELEENRDKRKELLTFVVVGGGPTGVELSGTIGELARQTLKEDFRRYQSREAKVILLEGVERVLPPYPSELSEKARYALQTLGVEVITNALVTEINGEGVLYKKGNENIKIKTPNIFWAAGVEASPLGHVLHQKTKAELDRAGRVVVEKNCSLKNYSNIFVIGDLAHFKDEKGVMLPGVAPVAMQQGQYVAHLIKNETRMTESFHYRDFGKLAVIGRAAAVAHIGGLKFSGYFAWLLWLFVHLMYIVAFENRVLVFIQWAWNYFTRGRGARLITGEFRD